MSVRTEIESCSNSAAVASNRAYLIFLLHAVNCRGNDVLFPLKCLANVIAAHKKFLASAVKLSFDKASETPASLLPDLKFNWSLPSSVRVGLRLLSYIIFSDLI